MVESLVDVPSEASAAAATAAPALPIGVVGGGQLAWMLAGAAQELGIPVAVQTPSRDDPATRLATRVVEADPRDGEATRRLASGCRAITFENEWVDLEALAALEAEGVRFVPSLRALAPLVNKRSQRELLQRLNLPAPAWRPLADLVPLPAADPDPKSEHHVPALPAPEPGPALPPGWSYPIMAKAATGGYDGKATLVLREPTDLEELLESVDPANWIVERFVAFELELSQLVCRDQQGQVRCYPLVQTHQHHRVCDWVLAPAAVPHAVQAFARNIAVSLLTAIDYVGVLSIELFYGPEGLQINEIAPRTHNSGHVTIEASHTSQFAQQARIVAGLPMGEVELKVPGALMVNLLGFERFESSYEPQREALACLPQAQLHWYGKHGSSLGRKLGHITLLLDGATAEERQRQARQRLEQVRAIWPRPVY
ncbi:5-(carboxyamino)imidazole ribonucleotide synthase [Cyanobium sp. NIES-981]|uniref:5-(carboxyamino)imidazole ribonucleotide synthase n=1 Tax=Cyanobium sp. NIES-981 TaxID=1851505 RepID=UPI001560E342|nr:5-(carboxyamino)imidazole ribonucleotide synthase [Cyanobium sp. NIES-981]